MRMRRKGTRFKVSIDGAEELSSWAGVKPPVTYYTIQYSRKAENKLKKSLSDFEKLVFYVIIRIKDGGVV